MSTVEMKSTAGTSDAIRLRMRNLLPACKNIGTTHITNGCYRLHPVEWNIGEAAGVLAAEAMVRAGLLGGWGAVVLALWACARAGGGNDDDYALARERMLREQIEARGVKDEPTLRALRRLLDTYATTGGTGASLINFFKVPGIADPAVARGAGVSTTPVARIARCGKSSRPAGRSCGRSSSARWSPRPSTISPLRPMHCRLTNPRRERWGG